MTDLGDPEISQLKANRAVCVRMLVLCPLMQRSDEKRPDLMNHPRNKDTRD